MASPFTLTIDRRSQPDWDMTVIRPEGGGAPDPVVRDLSEPELIEACVAGRPGAFDLLVERHRRAVYQLCYRFVSNHEDASELSQEVFLRAFRGLKNFKGQAAIGTWLHRIAVNVCLNRVAVKSPRFEPVEKEEHVDTSVESPADQVLRDERAARVRAAVARLPKKQRAALILRTWHDLPHQEVARLLGTSVGAAKANVFHALQNLKKALGDLT
jgi:RNA polymerase sigma-70 factor (ECF subfamily)